MQRSGPKNNSSQKLARTICSLSGIVMVLWINGCSSGTNSSTPATPQPAPQSYFAPYVHGIAGLPVPQTFIFDDMAATFSQETFALNLPQQQIGLQVINAGSFTPLQRGLLSLEISTNDGTKLNPAETGSFAVELAGQAGGLVQLVGQPVQPLVPATQCPNFTSAQPYQFITIPGPVDLTLGPTPPGSPPGTPALAQNGSTWNPMTDTAYGSVNIVSSGGTVTFQNISQYILPPLGAPPQAPTQPSAPSVPSACGSTTLGDITGVPGQYVVTNPGTSNAIDAPPQAAIGIGPNGLLVEDNGSTAFGLMANTSPGIHYENILGAGTGAVGLPKPSSALDTSDLTGKQYLGFIYAAGSSSPAVTWSSHLASFGFPAARSGCPVPANAIAPIYGGDFPQNNGQDNPSASPDGYGNCDFTIDLGAQQDNGLYRQATVYIGSGYSGNMTPSSFPAVAIAGQLNGKYAIFLIGKDSIQPWVIYLLQSN